MADITKIDDFIQSSPHPAWLATTQGNCVYANPALERLTGFNSDRINQADWRSFLLEETEPSRQLLGKGLSQPELRIEYRSACEGSMTSPNASTSSPSATKQATARNYGCLPG